MNSFLKLSVFLAVCATALCDRHHDRRYEYVAEGAERLFSPQLSGRFPGANGGFQQPQFGSGFPQLGDGLSQLQGGNLNGLQLGQNPFCSTIRAALQFFSNLAANGLAGAGAGFPGSGLLGFPGSGLPGFPGSGLQGTGLPGFGAGQGKETGMGMGQGSGQFGIQGRLGGIDGTGLANIAGAGIDGATEEPGKFGRINGGVSGSTGRFDAGTGRSDAGAGRSDAGAGRSDAGAGRFNDGRGQFDAGTGRIDTGTGRLDAGTRRFDAGTGRFDAGTGRFNDRAGRLNAGTNGFDPIGRQRVRNGLTNRLSS